MFLDQKLVPTEYHDGKDLWKELMYLTEFEECIKEIQKVIMGE